MAEEPETQTSPSPQQSSSQRSLDDTLKHPQGPVFCGTGASSNSDVQMFPVMYPALVPGSFNLQNHEQMNRGAGIYAVPVLPYMGPIAGYSPNTLIPLTYSTPVRSNAPESAAGGEEQGQVGQQQQHQQQNQAPQRQVVVRRFQIAIHLDLFLILKLAAVIFLFNQDGSSQRLVLLVFFASLIYLYQTGALAPLVRWLSQGMQRADAPPRPAARGENAPLIARRGNDNAAGAEGQAEAGNENQPPEEGNRAAENENLAEPGNRWWAIVKEIQMIIFGFITSLLPGFHNID